MPFKPKNIPHNKKYDWTPADTAFLLENFKNFSNRELAAKLYVSLNFIRHKCYEFGLKRFEVEYWTKVQVNYLLRNYTRYGDKELAEIFNKKWKKEKGWTLKHIEKKRKYLKLKRTAEQLHQIKERAKKKGVYREGLKKTWDKRGISPDGTIRYWKTSNTGRTFPAIKVNGRYQNWTHYTWELHYGKMPAGMNAVFKDGNQYNLSLDNLELISDAELSKRNSHISSKDLSDNYVAGILSHRDPVMRELIKNNPQIIDLKRKSLILNRTINEQTVKQTA